MTNAKTVARNSNVEMLRLVLMVAIFLWHLLVHGLSFLKVDAGLYTGNLYMGVFGAALLVPATYCFIFISGFYGVNLKPLRLAHMEAWLLIVSVACAAGVAIFGGGGNSIHVAYCQ